MAYYAERPLKDKASEKFLQSRGFKCVKHCGNQSAWSTDNFGPIYFDITDIVKDDDTLFGKIHESGYRHGEEAGRHEALTNIQKSLSDMVYPPLQKPTDDGTVDSYEPRQY